MENNYIEFDKLNKAHRDSIHLDEIYDLTHFNEEEINMVIIIAVHKGKYVFSYNKKWQGWDIPGGAREVGETVLESAKRELWEETGAVKFDIIAVTDCVTKSTLPIPNRNRPGRLYLAEIHEFENINDQSEITEIGFFNSAPDNLSWANAHRQIFEYVHQLRTNDKIEIR